MKGHTKPPSLSHRLTARLSLVVGIVSVSVCSVFVLIISITENSSLENEADLSISNLVDILEKPFWDFDIERIRIIGETFTRNSRISGLVFLEEDGEELYSFRREDGNRGIVRHGTVKHNGTILGEIEVSFTKKFFYKQLRELIFSIIMVTGFIFIIIFLVMKYLVRKQLQIPLKQFSRIVSSYADEEYDYTPVPVTLKEFGQFSNVLMTMRKRIHDQLLQLTNLNKALTAKNESIEAAKKQLQESEDRYRTLIENANEAVIVVCEEKLVFVNRKTTEMINIRQEDILAHPFEDFIHPDDKAMVRDYHIRRLKGDAVPGLYEFRVIRGDGEIRNAEVKSALINWEGTPATLNLIMDISERKKTEKALKESEEQFRLLAENSTDMISRHTPDGIYLYVSPACRSLLGYEPEELIGHSAFEFIHPEDIPAVEQSRIDITSQSIVSTMVFRARRKNGEYIWMETISRSVLDSDTGTSFELHAASRDVTERKLAEEERRESERKIRSIFNLSFEFIGLLTVDGILLEVNKTALDFIGADVSGVVGRPFRETPWWSHSAETSDQIKRVIRTAAQGTLVHEESTHPGKDGLLHIIDFYMKPVFNDKGQVTQLIAEGRDITEQKQAETALRESEERYRRLLASVTDYVYHVKIGDGHPVSTTHGQGCEAVTGYSPEEYARDSSLWYRMVFEPDQAAVTEHTARVLAGDSPSLEHRIIHKDGSIRWVRNTLVPHYNDQGRLDAYDGIIADITERKLAEEALRNSERKFSQVFHMSPALSAIVTLEEGVFIDANDSFSRFTGYTREELIGHSVSELNIWVDPAQGKHLRVLLQEQGQVNNFEAIYRRKSGDTGYGLMSATIVNIEGNSCLLSETMEITEWKRSEEAFRESEKQFRSTFEQAAVGMAHVAPDGKWLRVNKKLSDMLGYTREELLAGSFQEITHPDDLKADIDTLQRVLNNEIQNFSREKRYIRKDGSIIWINLTVAAHKGNSDVPEYMISVIEDISERKQAENALRESETKLRAMFENSRDAIGVSKKGIYFFSNPAYLKLFGYENNQDLLGTSILDSIAPAYREQMKQYIQLRASGHEVPTFYESRGIRKDGTEFAMEVNVSAYELLGETYTLGNIRDITERKHLEQERFLMQEKVIQAGKMTSLGLMVSGVGHEINNPNQVILSNMQYLAKAWDNIIPILEEYYRENGDFVIGGINFSEIGKEMYSIIADTITGSKKIKSIVDDLRTYSRKEDYKDASQIDLNKVALSSVSLMRGMINGATNNFSVHYDPGTLMINANSQRIEQVIVNLIQNACQALPDKSAAISIVTGKQEQNVFIRVSDEGAGMDAETLSNLKMPFFTTKRERGGTGLGLFVSDNIIKTYGGTLTITSLKGQGTEVTILFPGIQQGIRE